MINKNDDKKNTEQIEMKIINNISSNSTKPNSHMEIFNVIKPNTSLKDSQDLSPTENTFSYSDKWRNYINSLEKLTKRRIIIVTILIVLIYINSNYAVFIPSSYITKSIKYNNLKEKCINDNIFNLSEKVNNFFHYNEFPRYAMMSISSICIDLIFLLSLIDWTIYCPNMILIVSLLTFYGIRGVIQNIYQMPFPPGYFWGNPYLATYSLEKYSKLYFALLATWGYHNYHLHKIIIWNF